MILISIFWVLFYLIVPSLVILLCRKVEFFNKIGAILLVYIIGVIAGNALIFPFEGIAEHIYPLQDILTSVTIPLAMPLILFSCNFRKLPIRSASFSLIFGLISMIIAVVVGFFIFKGYYPGEGFNKIAGMIVGVYTGGTPNLASLKMMLGASETDYLILNTFDMIASFLYLAFLMAIGIRIFRKILPYEIKESQLGKKGADKKRGDDILIENSIEPETGMHKAFESKSLSEKDSDMEKAISSNILSEKDIEIEITSAELSDDLYKGIFKKENFGKVLKAILLSIIIAGISLALSFIITGSINMIVLILTLTTLAIIASNFRFVSEAKKSYDVGMYLVLIFSLVISSMVNIFEINVTQSFYLFLYLLFTIFFSLTLQVCFSRLFKIDADTTIITSVTLINSPLFVPMIADAMKNKKIIITGITIGLIGYAAGNYIGVILSRLLG